MSKSLNNFQMETFDSRAELEETLTKNISRQLKNSITETGGASLMVSGGSTPVILFKRLAQTKLAWQKVFVGLVDERWVPPNHQDSNEKLLRENLLQYEAKEEIALTPLSLLLFWAWVTMAIPLHGFRIHRNCPTYSPAQKP